MKTIKPFLVIMLILICLLVILLVIQKNQEKDINFQMNKLRNGTTEQKINAINFITDEKIYSAIPEIIKYVDSEESIMKMDVKWTLSCVATQALGKITNLTYGETCNSSNSKTDEEIVEIKRKWKEWFNTEYQTWLESVQK